ncbi:MAG: hypothetical protein HKP10_06155 [Kiritimatiellales bacterium]|nr:hypothetical protein [Kiritimatiellales bacterium]
MVVFNIGYDGIFRSVPGNCSIGFIGFNHHDIAIPRNLRHPFRFAADAVSAIKHLGNHCCGRRFAVRSAYGDASAVAHERRKHLASAGNRYAQFERLPYFRMGIGYRG